MQIDFVAFLQDVLSRARTDLALLPTTILSETIGLLESGKLAELRTLPVPRDVDADFGCNVAFVLAALYRKKRGIEVPPSILAPEVIALLERFGATDRYELSFSANGHLNCLLKPSYRMELLKKIMDGEDAQSFFEADPLGDLPPTEFFNFSWESVLKLNQGKANVQEFLQNKEVIRRGWSEDVGCMLLSLLGDLELDIVPFVKNMKSRQNVPWFIRRYLHDSRLWLRENRKSSVLQGMPPLFFVESNKLFCREMAELGNQLLAVRQSWSLACESARPELALTTCLNLMKQFYRIYYQPRFRGNEFCSNHSDIASAFFFLLSCSNRVIDYMLKRIRPVISRGNLTGPE